jgi:hypothetical protein
MKAGEAFRQPAQAESSPAPAVTMSKSESGERLIFAATVQPDGRLQPDAVNATAGRLARWKGRHVTVTVSRFVRPKSMPQLALYFAAVVPPYADYCGYDPDEMHKELKRAYLVPQLVVSRLTGEEIKELPSLRDLNVEEMTAYLERCLREGRQLGITFDVATA